MDLSSVRHESLKSNGAFLSLASAKKLFSLQKANALHEVNGETRFLNCMLRKV